MLKFACIWSIISLAFLVKANPKGIIKSDNKKIYVINIGVNLNVGSHQCTYCANDVLAMQKRLEADSAQLGCRIEIFNFINQKASLENINEAFGYLAENATYKDKVVLYYAGISLPVKQLNDKTEINHFLLGNANRSKGKLEGDYFTIGNLKTWLDKIAATDFLLISDAGPTDTYIKDFLENLTHINSTWRSLDNKNRIFLFPAIAGFDDFKNQRGYFSEVITDLPSDVSLMDLLDPYKIGGIYADIKTVENLKLRNASFRFSCAVKMFDERAFKADYAFLFDEKTSATTRGIDLDELAPDTIDLNNQRAPRQIALVIGVNNYLHWNTLGNPVLDANTIGNILQDKYGFEIWRLTQNPTLKDISKTINDLKKEKLNGPYDRLFLFFAGHGHYDTLTRTGHLIVSDSKKPQYDPKFKTFIQHNYLINEIEKLTCRHIMLVIDACYSGSIQKVIRYQNQDDCNYTLPINWQKLYEKISNEQFIKRNMACPTRRYITSGGAKYTVPDGEKGKHSPFARYFIDKLTDTKENEGILTFTDLLPGLGHINPLPRYGKFGNDSETSDFMFMAKK